MNIVLTDWRGIFTAQDAELELLPHPEDTHYGKLSLLALQYSPYITITELPHTVNDWKKIKSISPSHTFPYHATLLEHPTQSRNIILVSGDASTVLHHSTIPSSSRHAIQKEIFAQESLGKFPIGIAFKHSHQSVLGRDDLHELTFIGNAITSFTPIATSHNHVRKLGDKNISVKILTHMPHNLSRTVARNAGIHALEDSCLTGIQIAQMDDKELIQQLPHTTIFSEIMLGDKQRIVRVLNSAGHRVLHHDFSVG